MKIFKVNLNKCFDLFSQIPMSSSFVYQKDGADKIISKI